MKASDILLDSSLPRGTKEGYAIGCRGSHCPGVEWFGISCERAHGRYSSDYNYRKRVDAGMTPAAIVEAEAVEREAERAREVQAKLEADARAKKPKRLSSGSRTASSEPGVRRRPGRPVKPPQHGTRAQYKRGCRGDCPGGENGLTCREANTLEQRQFGARGSQPLAHTHSGGSQVDVRVEQRGNIVVMRVRGAMPLAGLDVSFEVAS